MCYSENSVLKITFILVNIIVNTEFQHINVVKITLKNLTLMAITDFPLYIPNLRRSVNNHTIWGLGASSFFPLCFYYASVTILPRWPRFCCAVGARLCYDHNMTMKMRLRLVYAYGDSAANLLRPLEAMELHVHFRCVFESFLYKI